MAEMPGGRGSGDRGGRGAGGDSAADHQDSARSDSWLASLLARGIQRIDRTKDPELDGIFKHLDAVGHDLGNRSVDSRAARDILQALRVRLRTRSDERKTALNEALGAMPHLGE